MSPDVLLLLLLVPLLAYMAASDVKHMRIPNWLVLCMVAVFAIFAPFMLDTDEIVLRAGIATAVLVFGFVAFILGLVGGGDVKAIAALMLFVPANAISIAHFAFTLSTTMLIGIAIILIARRCVDTSNSNYVSLTVGRGYPMGLSIALAGIIFPAVL